MIEGQTFSYFCDHYFSFNYRFYFFVHFQNTFSVTKCRFFTLCIISFLPYEIALHHWNQYVIKYIKYIINIILWRVSELIHLLYNILTCLWIIFYADYNKFIFLFLWKHQIVLKVLDTIGNTCASKMLMIIMIMMFPLLQGSFVLLNFEAIILNNLMNCNELFKWEEMLQKSHAFHDFLRANVLRWFACV